MGQEGLGMIGLARTTDPSTSHEAAARADLNGSEAEVLEILRRGTPLTDQSIFFVHQDNLKRARGALFPRKVRSYSESRLRTARKELQRRGLVEWTGETRKLSSGRSSRVWMAVW